MEKHRLKVFVKRVLRRISGPNGIKYYNRRLEKIA
jgi:hypothetical protein